MKKKYLALKLEFGQSVYSLNDNFLSSSCLSPWCPHGFVLDAVIQNLY